jgi:ABC-2 type transport system ATP-binding protein
MTDAVIFENVGRLYSGGIWGRTGIQAVQGISLRIPAGSVFGLLGPNRAGKTTLVKLLLSLCRLTQGSISRLGSPVSDNRTLSRIGYMHENQTFPRYLTATELLNYYGSLTLVPPEKLRVRVPLLLEQVGLADRVNEPISRFSKGMVQRLGLAQALINEPELLILDEPAEGLDLLGRRLLREVMAKQKEQGRTVLLVSHVLSDVEQMCDRIAVLVRGKMVAQGSVQDLIRDPATGATRPLESVLLPLYEAGSP